MAYVARSGSGREPYWRLVIARWKDSGKTVRAFCLAEDLKQATFYWWRRELIRRDQPKPKAAFFPVRVLTEPTESSSSGVEVVLANGRHLRVGVGFDSQTLAQVVALLEDGGAPC